MLDPRNETDIIPDLTEMIVQYKMQTLRGVRTKREEQRCSRHSRCSDKILLNPFCCFCELTPKF